MSYWAMFFAHLGFALSVFGIVIASSYGEEMDLHLRQHESINLQGYQISFVEEQNLSTSTYYGSRVKMHLNRGHFDQDIYPEKRIYRIGHVVMTDADIDYNLWRDIYVALGSPTGDNSWSLRVYYKPCIRFIWLGGILMSLAGLLAFLGYLKQFYSRS
jgi:cytochrome c-type biogenesis protein CcmF